MTSLHSGADRFIGDLSPVAIIDREMVVELQPSSCIFRERDSPEHMIFWAKAEVEIGIVVTPFWREYRGPDEPWLVCVPRKPDAESMILRWASI